MRKEIHLIQAGQVKPFLDTAIRLGVPVDDVARETGLPVRAVRRAEGVIGEAAAWRFLEKASESPNCEHLGYLAALAHPVDHAAELGGMAITLAGSLGEILEVFCREIVRESDSSKYQLVRRSGQTWFTRELGMTAAADGWQPEQYVLTFIFQLVRLCAPGDWLPKKVRIATRGSSVALPAEWHSIEVEWGWHRTEVQIENALLNQVPRLRIHDLLAVRKKADIRAAEMALQDLVDRQIWSHQAGLNIAAGELGMSGATLKRRLDTLGTTYSKVLGDRRLHHAIKMLEDTELSVQEIGASLGYSAVSNFSRAFSRSKGMSPRNWRLARVESS